jgi:hypothetical protein
MGIESGFGLNTMRISNVLLSQAVATIAGQILAVSAITSSQGPLSSLKMALMVLMCLYFVMPFTPDWATWAGLPTILIILWVYTVTSSLATTCSSILFVLPLKFDHE